jgi:hypothetical protein
MTSKAIPINLQNINRLVVILRLGLPKRINAS